MKVYLKLLRIVFFLKYGWSNALPFVSRGRRVKNVPQLVFVLSHEEWKFNKNINKNKTIFHF